MVYDSSEFKELIKSVTVDGMRHPHYHMACEHEEEMSVHINGDKPMKILERVRPREDVDVRAYRIESYEPITKAASDKAVHVLTKIFNPTLSSIRWKDQGDQIEKLKDYTLVNYPVYNSLQNYNKEVLLKKMLADPNGLMAVKPMEIPKSQTLMIKPKVVIYGSKNLWHFLENDFYLVYLSQYKREDDTIYTFDYYDTTNYVKFETRTYKNSQSQLEVEIKTLQLYPHNFKDKDGYGEIPAWPLKGMSKAQDDGTVFYESFFYPACPHWNLAITHESDLFGAYINHLHPIRYEITEECDYAYNRDGSRYSCKGGYIKIPGTHNGEPNIESMTCPGCNGSGLKSVRSPYGVYSINKEKLDETGSSIKPVDFVTVPTEPTKLLDERTERQLQRGMWAINMDVEDKVGEVQSGVAKAIDRSAQSDMLYNIASLIFDYHLQNEYYYINKYMFSTEANSSGKDSDKNLPEINRPTHFDVGSVKEALEEFTVAQKSGMDKNYIQIKQEEIVTRDMTTNPDLKNYTLNLLQLDPLPGQTVDDVMVNRNQYFISQQAAVIHCNLKSFVDRALNEDKEFLSKTWEQKTEVLKKFADEHIAQNKPKLENPGFKEEELQ